MVKNTTRKSLKVIKNKPLCLRAFVVNQHEVKQMIKTKSVPNLIETLFYKEIFKILFC